MSRPRHTAALRLALGTALLLLGTREAFSAVTLGPPIEVPAPIGFVPPYDTTSLAVLEDGSFAIGRRTHTRGFELLFYSPEGSLLGEPVLVYAEGRPGPVYGGVGAFGDRYFVTWEVHGSGRAVAAFYSRQGERLDRVFRWPYSDIPDAYRYFQYARGPLGRILPFFYFQAGQDRFGYPSYAVWSQVFGPARFVGERIELLTERHYLVVEDAALNEQGRFVVSFLRCPRNPRSRQPCTRGFQIFDDGWRPRSPVLTQGVPPVSQRLGPGLIWLAMARTGDFLAGWAEAFGSPPDLETRVFARLFRRDGSPAGPVTQLNAPRTRHSGQPRVRATHERTFVVAWVDIPDGFTLDVHLREVDGRTGKRGEQLLVAKDINPIAYEFELNSSGRGVIWYGDHLRLVTVQPDQEDTSHD